MTPVSTRRGRTGLGQRVRAANPIRTNAQLVDDIGTRAGQWAGRSRQQVSLAGDTPRVVGTKQHTYAKVSVRPSTVANSTRGWRVGDPINNLTAKGNVPSWTAVRQRFWKNQAFYNAAECKAADLARMRQGLAPQRVNRDTGLLESMHLHHDPPQSAGGLFDFESMWPPHHWELNYGSGS